MADPEGKFFFGNQAPPPFSQGLGDRAPTLPQGQDPALVTFPGRKIFKSLIAPEQKLLLLLSIGFRKSTFHILTTNYLLCNNLMSWHNIKKLRNNLEKSRSGGVRLLCFGDKTIDWRHLYQAYKRNQSSNSLKLHERLTEEHFSLG